MPLLSESLVADFAPTKLRSTPLSSNYSTSQIIHRIDTDVARLNELSRAMNARRNRYVPVLGLPAEILGNIIELCADTDPPCPIATRQSPELVSPTGSRAPGWLGWVRLGHICQHLRHMVLEMPALWATIAFALPRGHVEILERARDTPLTVILKTSQAFPDLLNSAEAHFLSAKMIQMDLDLRDAKSMFEPPEKEFMALEKLEVFIGNIAQDVTSAMIDLPALRAPRLRHIKLRNNFISLPYSSLVTFDLRFQDTFPRRPGPVQTRPLFRGHALVDVLRRCTNLRQLFLRGTQMEELPAPSPSRAAVSLPFLTYLEMESTVSFCRSVWSNLVLEPHTCVKVRFGGIRRGVDAAQLQVIHAEEEAFLHMLLHRSGEPGAPSITGIRLDCRAQDLRIAFAVTRVGAFTQEKQGPFSEGRAFSLDIQLWRRDQASLATLFEQVLKDLPTHIELADVDALAFTSPRTAHTLASEWRSWLTPLNFVRSLVCNEFPPHPSLWYALCPQAELVGVAPALQNLHTLFILPEHPPIRQDFNATAYNIPREHILGGLNRRVELEARIERMVLGTYWGLSRTVDTATVTIEELQTVVPQVVDMRRV